MKFQQRSARLVDCSFVCGLFLRGLAQRGTFVRRQWFAWSWQSQRVTCTHTTFPLQVMDAIHRKCTSDAAFTPDAAKKAGLLAEALCKWVLAVEAHDTAAAAFEPQRAALAEAESVAQAAAARAQAAQADAKAAADELAAMEADLAAAAGAHPACQAMQPMHAYMRCLDAAAYIYTIICTCGKMSDGRQACAALLRLACLPHPCRLKGQQVVVKVHCTAEKRARLDAAGKAVRSRADRAERLLAALESERGRWAATAGELANAASSLAGSALLAGAAVTYLGPHGPAMRELLAAEFADIASACCALR